MAPMSPTDDLVPEPFRCHCCELYVVSIVHRIAMTDRQTGQEHVGEWCEHCWPLVEARLLQLIGGVGSA